MATLQSISAALKDTSTKKENLKKAFEDLKSHSSSLASFTLKWKDIEDHFDSIEKSIKEKFEKLSDKDKQIPIDRTPAKPDQTAAKPDQTPAKPDTKTPVKTPAKTPAKTDPSELEIAPRPELKNLCAKSDAKGLRSFLVNHKNESGMMRAELPGALRSAPDPASLVLNCLDGFFPAKVMKPADISPIRRACALLLERLDVISPEISNQVKERARKIANEWKPNVSLDGETPVEAQAFLQLLVTYDIASSFNEDEFCDVVMLIAKRKQTPAICAALGITNKMPDFVQKLINKGKQLEAINFIYHFDLVNKYPPVPLLKSHLKEAKKAAQEILKNGKNSAAAQNDSTNKELQALRDIIKVIDDHKLESQYSRASHEKRIEQLLKERADRKRANVLANSKPQQQQPANKRPRPAPPSETNAAALAAPQARPVGSFGSTPGGLFGDRSGSYGLSGLGTMYNGLGSSYGTGLGSSLLNLSGNRSPPHLSGSRLYSSGSLGGGGGGGLYDKPLGYNSSYPLSGPPPSYRPSYYP